MDVELMARKVTQAERALSRVRGRLPGAHAAFAADYDAQDIVYRNYVIVVQNCVDIAAHLISEKGWETPRSLGETFEILARRKMLSGGLGKGMRDLVVLRNLIVHDYARIDIARAYPLIKSALKLIPAFCGKFTGKAR